MNPMALIKQQWQAIARWLLGQLGLALVAKGLVSSGAWASIENLVISMIGILISLVPLIWSVWSNQPKVIHATSDQLKADGKV